MKLWILYMEIIEFLCIFVSKKIIMGFYSDDELKSMGFLHIGRNVKLSKMAQFYNTGNISIDDNSRIDDFCILSAGKSGIKIGKNVHIACYCSLIGEALIEMHDFSGLSSKVAVYSSSDDYSGLSLTNPTVPSKYKKVQNGNVILQKHVIVGAMSVILPNVTIGTGSAIGALSLVTKSCEEFGIYIGNPAKFFKKRSQRLIELEKQFYTEEA